MEALSVKLQELVPQGPVGMLFSRVSPEFQKTFNETIPLRGKSLREFIQTLPNFTLTTNKKGHHVLRHSDGPTTTANFSDEIPEAVQGKGVKNRLEEAAGSKSKRLPAVRGKRGKAKPVFEPEIMELASSLPRMLNLCECPSKEGVADGSKSLASYILQKRTKQVGEKLDRQLLVNGTNLQGSCGLLGARASTAEEQEEEDLYCEWETGEEAAVYLRTEAPFCAVCIGVQGAGKSHTMNVILENCMFPEVISDYCPIIQTAQQMAGLVLHFDQSQNNVCEAVGLSTVAESLLQYPDLTPPHMVVLVSPTFYKQRREFYEGTRVAVYPLLFDWASLTAMQLRKLMRLGESDAQLYVSTMLSLLRDYQRDNQLPVFSSFLTQIEEKCNVSGQSAPLVQVSTINFF